jgi:hypothetical protein
MKQKQQLSNQFKKDLKQLEMKIETA